MGDVGLLLSGGSLFASVMVAGELLVVGFEKMFPKLWGIGEVLIFGLICGWVV